MTRAEGMSGMTSRYRRCEHRHYDGTRCSRTVAVVHWYYCWQHAHDEPCRQCIIRTPQPELSELEKRYLDGDR